MLRRVMGLFAGYAPPPGTFDELFDPGGLPRPPFRVAMEQLGARGPDDFARAQAMAELALLNQGVTFSVYADQRGSEKIFPFCLVPRIVAAADFQRVERGLDQRVRALGLFLDDVYGPQRILAAEPVLRELVLG